MEANFYFNEFMLCKSPFIGFKTTKITRDVIKHDVE